MTESEWLERKHPYDLIYHKSCRNDRKHRLLACACTRRILPFLADEAFQRAVQVSESYAEGQASDADLRASRREIAKIRKAFVRISLDHSLMTGEHHAAAQAVAAVLEKAFMSFKMSIESASHAADRKATPWEKAHARETRAQLALTRDIFANPFRPLKSDERWFAWRDGIIPKLAHAAYEARALPSGELDPVALAILADALEESGCTNEPILGHLRGPGPHVRGCWVLDLILGKAG